MSHRFLFVSWIAALVALGFLAFAAPARGIVASPLSAESARVTPTTVERFDQVAHGDPALLPPDPSLLRARVRTPVVPVALSRADTPEAEAVVRRLYDHMSLAYQSARRGASGPDGEIRASRRVVVGRLGALSTLLNQKRFHYIGPAAKAPQPRNTTNICYCTTQFDDVQFVFELKRSEFPNAFH